MSYIGPSEGRGGLGWGAYVLSATVPAPLDTTGLTRLGNFTGGGGLDAAFDGNENQGALAGSRHLATGDGFLGIDWGAGADKVITEVTVISSNDNGFSGNFNGGTYSIYVQGSTDNFSSSIVDLGGSNTSVAEGGTTKQTVVLTPTSLTAYRYTRIRITRNPDPTNDNNKAIAELKFTGY